MRGLFVALFVIAVVASIGATACGYGGGGGGQGSPAPTSGY
jgi:hypothetical protein